MLLAMALRFKRQGAFRKHVLALRLAAVVAEMLDVNANLATLPRQGDAHGGPYKEMSDYHDSTFFQQFRFRKHHFWIFLQALHWTDAAGFPITIKCGTKNHESVLRAHHVLMILLRRLAFPSRWCNLNLILGGQSSASSPAFNWALNFFFRKYVPLIQDMSRWKHKFSDFARRLREMGAPFDNLVSFVDGHFDPTCRPGGDGCRHLMPKDYHMYNPLHKDHGIMFQGAVMVNGLSLCWGPFGGNDNDAKTVEWAGVTEQMRAISNELGEDFSNFSDSAYTQNRFMQCIQKCPAGGSLPRSARRFNALMARFRIVIEDLFGETGNVFAALQHKQNKRLGKQDCGKLFPVSMFLFNVRSIFYGNETGSYFGLDGLESITLKEFLDSAELVY